MIKVVIFGSLSKELDISEIELDCSNFIEALKLIDINTNGKLSQTLINYKNNDIFYSFKINEVDLNIHNIKKMYMLPLSDGDVIFISPSDRQSGFEFMAMLFISLIVFLIQWLIMTFLMPVKLDLGDDDSGISKKRESYLGDGNARPVVQGNPVPLGYGRLMINPIMVYVKERYFPQDMNTEEEDHGIIEISNEYPELINISPAQPKDVSMEDFFTMLGTSRVVYYKYLQNSSSAYKTIDQPFNYIAAPNEKKVYTVIVNSELKSLLLKGFDETISTKELYAGEEYFEEEAPSWSLKGWRPFYLPYEYLYHGYRAFYKNYILNDYGVIVSEHDESCTADRYLDKKHRRSTGGYSSKGKAKGRDEPLDFDDTLFLDGEMRVVDIISEGDIKGFYNEVENENENATDDEKKESLLSAVYFDQNCLNELVGSKKPFELTRNNFINEKSFDFTGDNILEDEYHQVIYYIDDIPRRDLKEDKTVSINLNRETYPMVNSLTISIEFARLFCSWKWALMCLYDIPKRASGQVNKYAIEEALVRGTVGYSQASDYLSQFTGRFPVMESLVLNASKNSSSRKIDGDIIKTPVVFYILLEGDGKIIRSGTWVINHKCSGSIVFSQTVTEREGENWSQYKNLKFSITRNTFDSPVSNIVDEAQIRSFHAGSSLRVAYKNCAKLGLTINTEDAPQLPHRSYICDLKIVDVPSNYTPPVLDKYGNIIKGPKYEGVWNGTFKKSWTNNPAWIFYDACINEVYGAGKYVKESSIDKYTLYLIGQYCDAVDENGNFVGVTGDFGLEQRFTVNIYLTSQEDAFTLLNNLSSAFRGMAYWANNFIAPTQDRPKRVVQQFNNSNVIEGKFTYSTGDNTKRYTVATVRWNDPMDFYKAKIERYEDFSAICQFGVNEIEIAAFGCTSRAQAYRAGKWMITTGLLENEYVTFSTGFEGFITRPGDVIVIQDNLINNENLGGRVASMESSNEIIVDREIPQEIIDDPSKWMLSINIPKESFDPSAFNNEANKVTDSDIAKFVRTRQVEEQQISSIEKMSNNRYKVTTGIPFSTVIAGTSWIIYKPDENNAKTEKWRVVNTSLNDGYDIEVLAVKFEEKKFSQIDDFPAGTGNSINIDYSKYPIYPPSNLEVELINLQPAYLKVTFTPSTGRFVEKHVLRGKLSKDSGFKEYPVTVFENRGECNIPYPGTDGTFIVELHAVQIQGKKSQTVQKVVEFTQSENPDFYEKVRPIIGTLSNWREKNDVYIASSPSFTFALDESYTNLSQDPSSFKIRLNKMDKYGSLILTGNWIDMEMDDLGKEILINKGKIKDQNVDNWPFRYGQLETLAEKDGHPSSLTTKIFFNNPPPEDLDIFITSKDKNSFTFSLSGTVAEKDLIKVHFFISENEVDDPVDQYVRVINSSTKEYGLTHNLNVDVCYVWYRMTDVFSDEESVFYGPIKIDVFEEVEIEGFAVYADTKEFKSGSTIKNLPVFRWKSQEGALLYRIEVSDSDKEGVYSFVVPPKKMIEDGSSEEVNSINEFVFDNVAIGEKPLSYRARIQVLTIEGYSGFSAYSNFVGASSFYEKFSLNGTFSMTPYEVDVEDFVSSLVNEVLVDFSLSNRIKINLSTTKDITLIPSNIVENSEYLLEIKRESGKGSCFISGSGIPMGTIIGRSDLVKVYSSDNEIFVQPLTNQ